MPVTIRPAGPGDAPTVYAFIRAHAEDEGELQAAQVELTVLHAQMEADAPPFECLLAESDGRAIGFALYFHIYSTWQGKRGLWLEDLFVLPEARRQGIGQRLFAEVTRRALERGCGRLEWAVLNGNQGAVDFYQRAGARFLSEWTTCRLTEEQLLALQRSKGEPQERR